MLLEKKLTIITSIPKLTLNVDKYKFSLAIKNIIDNAIKYGSKTKLIELKVNKIDVNLEISIKDFWGGFSILINKFNPLNKELLKKRSFLQNQILI